MMDSTFPISEDLRACIYSQKVSFTSDLFLGLICSFSNVTLSSITSCRLIIYSEPSSRWKLVSLLAREWEGVCWHKPAIPTKCWT